ncbi:MAG: TMEM198/TM7SF3 family protein [Candidatus Granulicatella sp. P6S_S16_bin.50.1]|nr:TMEM198/TM7SF3 family protein [Candidatus Granulicatella sp. P6S_S16_bin.50.1]
MKSKRRVKERHVSQLRKLIEAVALQNGEEGTLPMSFLPVRAIITILSVAAVVCGVVVFGRMAVVEAGLFQALQSMFSTGDSEVLAQVSKVLFGLALHFAIMFAALAIVLYCCHRSVRWEWKKLVARGNEEVTTWKSSPREASREAVEALEAYLQEHATLGKPSKLKETVQAAATGVGAAMEKVSKEHEVAKRLTSVEASRVRALRRLLKLVLKINGREEQLPKSSYWLRIYVLITVAIAGIVIGLVSGFFQYLKLFIACLVTLQLNVAFGYLAFIWPFVVIWCIPIAAFVAVLGWHRRETFKEWKELLAVADREVEEWSQTTAVPDEVAELQKFLKKAHKYY